MQSNPMKFEAPTRVAELDIQTSLKRAGLTEGMTVCDYGSGTGIFTVEAARLTNETVYALDMDPKMLGLVEEKIQTLSLGNIKPLQVTMDAVPLSDASVDRFLIVTVMHEIEDVPTFVSDVKRVLKSDGKVMLIDFYKKETPMGPPVSRRMSAYQAARHFFRENIHLEEQFELGENLYMLVLHNQL